MGVKRLHVEGYRSLTDVTVELAQVTVIGGTERTHLLQHGLSRLWVES